MNPLIEEMLVRQRYEERLREAERYRLAELVKQARQHRNSTIHAYIIQVATFVSQRLRAQLKFS